MGYYFKAFVFSLSALVIPATYADWQNNPAKGHSSVTITNNAGSSGRFWLEQDGGDWPTGPSIALGNGDSGVLLYDPDNPPSVIVAMPDYSSQEQISCKIWPLLMNHPRGLDVKASWNVWGLENELCTFDEATPK